MKIPFPDLFSSQAYSNQPISLFELHGLIRETLEERFPETYWVIAEISKVTERGHCYLELVEKDTSGTHAQARATIWSNKYRRIASHFEKQTGQPLRQGLKILLNASVKFHELYGLSLDVNDIDANYTVGDLARQRQETIARLDKEGLLDKNKQLLLTEVPQRIAIISSPTAAGYQDFLHQLGHNPYGYWFTCTLYSAVVQGNEAPASITQAFQLIRNAFKQYDAVVLIRGGGSQTDLNCFDDYTIAAAIAHAPIPVLTGIGHERDETIADLVAHTRLKTPTAVASFLIDQCNLFESNLTEVFRDIIASASHKAQTHTEQLKKNALMLYHTVTSGLSQRREQLNRYENTLLRLAEKRVTQQENQFKHLTQRLKFAIKNQIQLENTDLTIKELKIHLLDPNVLLKRGFSLTTHNRQIVKLAEQVKPGDIVEIRVGNGTLQSKIIDTIKDE